MLATAFMLGDNVPLVVAADVARTPGARVGSGKKVSPHVAVGRGRPAEVPAVKPD
jgi:hypothetical protein